MARVRNLAGRPIEQHNSPNRGGGMSAHRGVVLHIAQGTYRGTISWQNNPDQRYADGTRVTTSSTWIVGREPGEWAQMVDTDLIAWAHRGGSARWLSIELAGFAPASPSDWQVEACAQLLAWSAARYGHPIARADHEGERGLGHHSMDREQFGVEWGHDQCPGSGVIAAKDRIVRRARQIAAAGEEDDMAARDVWMEPIKRVSDGKKSNAASLLRYANEWSRRADYRTDDLVEMAHASRQREVATLEAVAGKDSGEILATLEAQHTERLGQMEQMRAELLERLDVLELTHEEIAELVRQGQSGEIEAAEVVRILGEKLTAAAEPSGDS